MKEQLRNRSGAARAGVCMAGMLSLAFSGYVFGETAAVERFELQIVGNSPGGSEIVAGDYAAAIEQIRTTPSLHSKYVRNTNLCVAYTAQGEFTLAEPTCKAALQAARSTSTGLQNTNRARIANKNDQAMAMNNLGVLRALQGDNQKALKYFESASNKSKDLEPMVGQNIIALEQRMGSEVVASY